MRGWLYIIQNGDIYKIGITTNFKKRMRQLKPDKVIAKLYSKEYKKLERELHKRYNSIRIPQTEYFRLNHHQVNELKLLIYQHSYPIGITIEIIIKVFLVTLFLFIFLFIFISLTVNDINNILITSFLYLERSLFGLSVISIFKSSNKYFILINEIKFRITNILSFILMALLFRFSSLVLF